MSKDEVSVEITIEEKQALKALAKLTRGVEDFENTTVKSVKKTDSAFSSFRGNLGAIAASGAIKAIAGGLKDLTLGSIEAAASTEKIKTQLEILTGSQQKAADLFKELTDFSASTPFQLQGIAEASAQLISFGFEAETVQGRIARIGEVAAGSGSDLKEVALIYGQVAAAGKLTGERLLQFQERAIPIGSALAKSMGIAESELRDFVSSGVVGFSDFEKAFNSMSESGGIFEGAIEKQSQTLNGVLSTLKDNFFILQAEIGEAFKPELVNGANVLISSLKDLTQVLVENREVLAAGINFISDYASVYLNLASQIIKTKTPLDEINEKILEQSEAIDKVRKVRDEFASQQGDFFGASPEMLKQQNEQLVLAERALRNLVEQRKEILKAPSAIIDIEELRKSQGEYEAFLAKKDIADTAANAKSIEQRRKLQLELNLIKEEQKIKEQEAILANSELEASQREEALSKLQIFQNAKADVELKIQLDKNTKIRDLESKRVADKAAFTKNAIAIDESRVNKQVKLNAAALADKQVFFSKAASLSQSGSKELAAIGKAAGLIQIAQATPPAVASSFKYGASIGGPPLGFAFAGIALAAQAEQARRMASFANGGVVGGFGGATTGNDNTVANVRNGEMMLDANQQRRLFDIADNKSQNATSNQMIEVTSIVQIDEREVARAVRNQKLEGFSV